MQSDDDLRQFVRDNAWGHHASCTCPNRAGAQQRFQSLGRRGIAGRRRLGIPKIPGFFIVSAIYMIGEKAADAILAAR